MPETMGVAALVFLAVVAVIVTLLVGTELGDEG